MNRHCQLSTVHCQLFLQGPSGVGKSALLREVLAPYAGSVRGFAVVRLIDDGHVIGFRAAPLEDGFPPLSEEYVPGRDGVFILRGHRDIPALEQVMLRAEQASREPGCRLILLDEIGGIELTSAVCMDALDRMLSGPAPCVGVFKSRESLLRMASRLRLKQAYIGLHGELEARLRACGELLTVTGRNREEIRGYMKKRLDFLV